MGGTLEVRDDGERVSVVLRGWSWKGERLTSETFDMSDTESR